MNNVPVYIIAGFLESGKTKFINEMLADEGVNARVVDMRWVKPLDEEAIARAAETRLVVTIENGVVAGGAGSAVLEVLASRGLSAPVKLLGIPDQFVLHGKTDALLAELGLDASGIARTVRESL